MFESMFISSMKKCPIASRRSNIHSLLLLYWIFFNLSRPEYSKLNGQRLYFRPENMANIPAPRLPRERDIMIFLCFDCCYPPLVRMLAAIYPRPEHHTTIAAYCTQQSRNTSARLPHHIPKTTGRAIQFVPGNR